MKTITFRFDASFFSMLYMETHLLQMSRHAYTQEKIQFCAIPVSAKQNTHTHTKTRAGLNRMNRVRLLNSKQSD